MKNKTCWACGKTIPEEAPLTKFWEICEECARKKMKEASKNDPHFNDFF